MLPPSNCGVLILSVVVFECFLQQVFPPCLRHFSLVTTLLFVATCFRFQPCRQQLHTEISSSVHFRDCFVVVVVFLSEALNLNAERFGAVRSLLSSAFVLYCLVRWGWSLVALVAVLCLQGPQMPSHTSCLPLSQVPWHGTQTSCLLGAETE